MTTDMEFYEFLVKNEEKTKDLLQDFKYWLINNIYSTNVEISSRTMNSGEEMAGAIMKQDEEHKKIAHLADTQSPFVSLYFKVDIKYNLECIKKRIENPELYS